MKRLYSKLRAGAIILIVLITVLCSCANRIDYESPQSVVMMFAIALAKMDKADARQYCTEEFNSNELDLIYRFYKKYPRSFPISSYDIPRGEYEIRGALRAANKELEVRINGDNATVWHPEVSQFKFELTRMAGSWKIARWPILSDVMDKIPKYF